MSKVNVIIKDETLGFDFSSLLSNPAVGVGMNAVLPGSSMALPFLNQALNPPKKPSGSSQLTSILNSLNKKPTSAPPPPPRAGSVATSSPAPPPPKPQVQSFVDTRQFLPMASASSSEPKQGMDKNILLIGGIALAGLGVFILTNNKGKRR